ncbi:MAG: hypothetical protein Q4C06_04040 [Bacillota bacterium]|nr:hypothetical protein [Bacillota bacterium]
MEERNEKILWEGYGLRLRSATRTRTGLICRTDQGLRELKKPRGGTESLYLAAQVKQQLRKNGFDRISRMFETVEGEPFYRYDGVLYILEDTMPPESLGEDSTLDFVRGAETLGQMHAAAVGLPDAGWDRERLPVLYKKRRRELSKMRRRKDKKGHYDGIDLLLMRYYEQYAAQVQEAEQLLQQGDYSGAVDRAAAEGAFCHNAYKSEALRLGSGGRIFVGNFDKCSRELPLADLAFYLRRYCKKTAGEREGVWEMLEAYSRYRSLSDQDLTLLMGMLVYPEKFLRLVNEYYNRRRACVSPAMEERLAAAAEEEKKGLRLKGIIEKGC